MGGGPVDLVREQQLGEHRPGLKAEVAPALVVLHHHLGTDDVRRHQVRSELDSREAQLEGIAQALHEERLPESRHALEEHVPGRQQTGQDPFDHRPVPDDAPIDLPLQSVQALERAIDTLFVRDFGQARRDIAHGEFSSAPSAALPVLRARK